MDNDLKQSLDDLEDAAFWAAEALYRLKEALQDLKDLPEASQTEKHLEEIESIKFFQAAFGGKQNLN